MIMTEFLNPTPQMRPTQSKTGDDKLQADVTDNAASDFGMLLEQKKPSDKADLTQDDNPLSQIMDKDNAGRAPLSDELGLIEEQDLDKTATEEPQSPGSYIGGGVNLLTSALLQKISLSQASGEKTVPQASTGFPDMDNEPVMAMKMEASKTAGKSTLIQRETKIDNNAGDMNRTKPDVAKPVFSEAINTANATDDKPGDKGQSGQRRGDDKFKPVSRIGVNDLMTGTPDKGPISKPFEIGDKIALKNEGISQTKESRIQGVEILQNRQSGDLRVLHLKLSPDNLGSVEARMRMTPSGLNIELYAERTDTARLLATDHRMLTQTLEKSGFHDDGRISVTVVERAATNTVHAGANAAQTGDQSFGNSGGQSGQSFRPDSQGSGSGGQGERSSSERTQTPQSGEVQSSDQNRETHASRDPRRIVI